MSTPFKSDNAEGFAPSPDMRVGEWVIWLHVPRGGYGYTVRVPARVESVGKSRVRIAAKLQSGGEKIVNVKPASLRTLVRSHINALTNSHEILPKEKL